MTKQKLFFWIICKCIKHLKIKYQIYISIQTLYSVLCWSTFGSDYNLESSWVWHYKLGTPVFWGVSPNIFRRSSQALSGWMGSVAAQLFSGLSKDDRSGSSPGFGWSSQEHSETCPEATPALSWLCAKGSCPVGRWTFTPVWGPECSVADFHSSISLYFTPLIFSSILTSLPVPAAENLPSGAVV